ncbi:hypothetical protein PROFUN_05070 [Planoprotostelium fungivorum]|uniref:Uncharacterized protein n=1 Tax=Planoprotostelium fungivorum TaxID=1890364 RepID=A0A2P6NSB1_9EUKA|nr:hypothetical protein PROFUN_05070 [Planoprotostelium fungivorum]
MGIKRPSQEPLGWMALHSKLFSQCKVAPTPLSDPCFSRTSMETIMQDTTQGYQQIGSDMKKVKEFSTLWTIAEE